MFVMLTSFDGEKVAVNTDHVTAVESVNFGEGDVRTKIWLTDPRVIKGFKEADVQSGGRIYVKETVEKVAGRLNGGGRT